MLPEIIVIDVPRPNCPNGRGKVPFVNNQKFVHHIPWEDWMPSNYIYDKRLWELRTGQGSTYYVLAKNQVLPMLEDGPFVIK